MCASCGATVYTYDIYGKSVSIIVSGRSVTVNDVTYTADRTITALSKHLRNCTDTRTVMAVRRLMREERIDR